MKLVVNCDGGSRGNPGHAAAGVVLRDEMGNVLARIGKYLGITTNNVAEYQSLIIALEEALKHKPESVRVIMDSELVVRQMNGEYKVKAAHLEPLFEKAKELAEKIGNVSFENVRRSDSYQSEADRMVNETLDRHLSG
ncbi:reverse transcriptase-like protein [Candidatus Woesearchaeota archaeon]|nr:MAG: reverse transcriptase-like protein [Candidatus Woesearchaeota archaeon]